MNEKYEKSLERKNYLFTFVISLWSHGLLLKNNLGVGFMKSIVTYKDDMGILYHSTEDIKEVENALWKLVKKGDPFLDAWYKKAIDLNSKSDLLISTNSFTTDAESLDAFIGHFKETFLYSTVIPYWVLAVFNKQIELGQDVSIYSEIMNKFEELRGQTRYPQLVSSVLDRYFDKVFEMTNIEIALLRLLAPEELLNFFLGKTKIDEKALKERQTWCLLKNDSTDFGLLFDYDKAGLFSTLIPKSEDINDVKSLKGSIAFRGYTKGTVKIINTLSDIEKFNDGDILVSINTNPSLMPAIIKCSGIITDEGGVMCHASIIARELKKPCIIGTKNATRVLHDGDLVEVDAEKGIVRIIKQE